MSEPPGHEKRRELPALAHTDCSHGKSTAAQVRRPIACNRPAGAINPGKGNAALRASKRFSKEALPLGTGVGFDIVLPDAVRKELSGRRTTSHPVRRTLPLWLKSASAVVIAIVVIVVIVMASASPSLTSVRSPSSAPVQVSPAHTTTTPSARVPGVQPPRAERLYREWVGGGWVLVDAMCTPVRGSFVLDSAPRALPAAAPRATLVRYPGSRE